MGSERVHLKPIAEGPTPAGVPAEASVAQARCSVATTPTPQQTSKLRVEAAPHFACFFGSTRSAVLLELEENGVTCFRTHDQCDRRVSLPTRRLGCGRSE